MNRAIPRQPCERQETPVIHRPAPQPAPPPSPGCPVPVPRIAQSQLHINVSYPPQHGACTPMPRPHNTPRLRHAAALDPAGITARVIVARLCRPRSMVRRTCRRGTRSAGIRYIITRGEPDIPYTMLRRDFRRRLVRRRRAARGGPTDAARAPVPPPWSVCGAVAQWVIRYMGEKWLREMAGNIVNGQWVRQLACECLAGLRATMGV